MISYSFIFADWEILKGELTMKVSELMDHLKFVEIMREKCWNEEPLTDSDYDYLAALLDAYRDILLSRDVDI